MITAAIISEFNPFHNGHRLLIEKARRELHADRILILMSGDYVQRGAPAVTDRYIRTQMALCSGCDAVLSYPARFAVSSAEAFAENAVRILDGLHCADYLVFGSECGDLRVLQKAACALSAESESYRTKLRSGLKHGLSFPEARADALPEFSGLLSSPNNILAVEYLKAIIKTDSHLQPVTMKREGALHGDNTLTGTLCSAGALRRVILEERDLSAAGTGIPSEGFQILKNDLLTGGAVSADDFSVLLGEKLFSASCPEEYTAYREMTADLANAIFNHRNSYRGFSSFAGEIKPKSMTLSHIRRALLLLLLGITKNTAPEKPVFTQLLGFRKQAVDLVSLMGKSASVPVIFRPAAEIPAMGTELRGAFNEETRVSNLYGMVRALKSGRPFINTLSRPIIKL